MKDFLNIEYMLYFRKMEHHIDLLMVSNIMDFERYFGRFGIDGIILSGGDNIGECTIRDMQERKLLSFAIREELPVLGICKGMQFINNYFGGGIESIVGHVDVVHNIDIVSPLWIRETGMRELRVNSFHKYGVKKNQVSKELKVACISKDGIVEALEHPDLPISGIQWHPERDGNNNNDIPLKILQRRI